MPRLSEGICLQLTSDVISRCKTLKIFTVSDFLTEDPEVLSKKIKTSFKDILLICDALFLEYASFPQRGDSFYFEMLENLTIFDTGSQRINDCLQGGIYTGEITEIHGPSGSGKTQFCLDVLSNLLQDTCYTALYLDTNCSFSSQRVEEMLMHKSEGYVVSDEKLKMVRVVNVYDVFNFLDIFDYVKDELQKKEETFFKNLRLLVIDSITHLLAPCFGGNNLNGLSIMSHVVQLLKILCSKYYLSVMICNNTVRGSENEIKPALGSSWRYVPSVSICLQKVNSLYKMDSVKSCRSGLCQDVIFAINDSGLSN